MTTEFEFEDQVYVVRLSLTRDTCDWVWHWRRNARGCAWLNAGATMQIKHVKAGFKKLLRTACAEVYERKMARIWSN